MKDLKVFENVVNTTSKKFHLNADDKDDFRSELLIKFFNAKAKKEFHDEEDFLYRMATNLLIDRKRKESRYQNMLERIEIPHEIRVEEDAHNRVIVQRIYESLTDPKDRKTFEMLALEFSMEEMAREFPELKKSKSMRSRVSRLRKMLQESCGHLLN